MKEADLFLEASEKKGFDAAHRKTLRYNIAQYDKKVIEGKEQFCDLELAKTRAAAIKQKSIDNDILGVVIDFAIDKIIGELFVFDLFRLIKYFRKTIPLQIGRAHV